MFRSFEPVILPLLTAVKARVVVEVGAGKGPNTELLLAWAEQTRRRVTVHVVDPAPEFAVEELEERYPDVLRFHRALSLDVLATIDVPDLVLIDGDHNWYTVYHELQAIERSAIEARRRVPVVALHDVDWPYGRRDLYYDPETIPEEHRQPYRRAGLVPGQAELHDDTGMNRSLANALEEHDRRNGVRTAVEDFTGGSKRSYRFVTVPGNHGLGVLAEASRVRPGTRLAAVLDDFESPDFLRDQCLRIEQARMTATIGLADAARAEAKASRRADEAQARVAEAERGETEAGERAATAAGEAKKLRAEAVAATESKHKARAELAARVAELEEVTAARDEATSQLAQARAEAERGAAEARDRIEALEAARAERETELHAEAEARAQELETALAARDRVSSELERARRDVERADADARAFHDQLRRFAGEVDELEDAIVRAEAGRAEAADALALRTEVFERGQRESEHAVAEREVRIRELTGDLERLETESSRQREALRGELESRHGELEGLRAESVREVQRLEAEASERTEAFHRERAELAARAEAAGGELADLKDRYARTEARRAELEKTLVKRDAALAALTERSRLREETLNARRFELRDQSVARISADLDLLRGDLERVANSHAWRFGHGLMRFLRLLTFRRSRTPGGVERSLLRLSRIDLPPRYTLPAPAPPAPREPPPESGATGEGANGGSANGAHIVNGNEAAGAARSESGATRLLRAGRTDHTAAGFVLDDRWEGLFTEAERQAARDRLAAADGV